MTEATEATSDPEAPEEPKPDDRRSPPAPGSLGIKERRAWQSWQLAVAALVALLLGMAIGHTGSGSNANAASGGRSTLTLPPDTGPGSAGATSTLPTTTVAATSTTVAPPGGAGTTAPPPTAAPPAGAKAAVLFQAQSDGNGVSKPFTIAGGAWNVGWAFDCARSPGGTGVFRVYVVPAGGAAPTVPAVDQQGRGQQGVTAQTSAGPQTLDVRTTCRWAVKITGVGS